MIRKYWGARGRNAYIFRTLLEAGIPVAFGSDVPIERLDPLAGMADAVRRAKPDSRDVFYPAERITAAAALHAFTAGCAWAVGQERSRGYLLPGYPADMAILSQDITRVAPLRLYDTRVLATLLDGKVVFAADDFSL
jgi:predicted amidohydrolase YtcJ